MPYCLPDMPRWLFHTAPKSWQPEELETTAPLGKFHPQMHDDVLATKFKVCSLEDQLKAAVEEAEPNVLAKKARLLGT